MAAYWWGTISLAAFFAFSSRNSSFLNTDRGSSKMLCPDLVGTWKLIRHHAWLLDEPTDKTFPTGIEAQAIIMYAPDGYMSAQFLPSTRQNSTRDTESESHTAESSSSGAYMAYSGEYYIEEIEDGSLVVSHFARITNVPNLSGVTQKRHLKIEDRADGLKFLTLRSITPIELAGESRIHEVILQRFPDNSDRDKSRQRT
ncbi:Lipocalin-like domain-containing protein [Paraphoma chrysanthemicola]|uniref:Lipocalin-like domain-containing protein n=1 Tax=Paraphoma chrysanthemicola TaxID=798071 RepID=A0A8K0VZ98_9PLEO|nr:Lipocalin-like domain-containing protein [Paraphoma chrysanthemicola]